MQKIINGIAIFSGAVALGIVGLGGYVFIRKDAIIDNVKSKVMEAVMPDIGSGITDAIPDTTDQQYLYLSRTMNKWIGISLGTLFGVSHIG
ncbi:MAG: hypothetical protein CM15mV11_1500 [Caudoviricetes sp.]|nr:MAG: hypothetical protein CM15mV11_1500 [Caudoviricetes sp.]